MAIDGMKVIDLDSHLVGDLESWEQTIEDHWRPYLPEKLPNDYACTLKITPA